MVATTHDETAGTSVPAVSMRGITKRFPGVVANDHVDFDLATGEVHALLGENGAGKSTLSNVLTGIYHPDEGTIAIGGEVVTISSPRDALAKGIGMVHQHFRRVPTFTVAETDAFFLAWRIPNALRALLAEGALSTALVPVFSSIL